MKQKHTFNTAEELSEAIRKALGKTKEEWDELRQTTCQAFNMDTGEKLMGKPKLCKVKK